jgi:hypothetical protein
VLRVLVRGIAPRRVLPESLEVARPDVTAVIGQRSDMKLVELFNEATL